MIAARLTAQLLSGPPARDPPAVAERLLAVQAQELRGMRLAIRARTSGLTVSDVDRALGVDRSLLVTWLNRGTLHLVRSSDYPWLQALTTPPLHTGNARRLREEGVSTAAAERGVGAIERSLAEEGPLARAQLRERIAAAGVPAEGQALAHILMLASLRGLIVRGPMIEGRHAFALVHDWLGAQAKVDRDAALAELARRYLAGHGPASDRDLARWAGLPLRDVRGGLAAIGSELEEREDGLVDLVRRVPSTPIPQPRLLGPFEPVLLGWTSRRPLVADHERLVTVNGVFRQFALVRGRAAATWRMKHGELEREPFAPLGDEDGRALAADAADVLRFLEGD